MIQPIPEARSASSTDEALSPIEQIAAGLTRQWLFDHQVVIFTMTSISRETIDCWIETVKATMENWPSNRPYLAIHDLSSEKVSLTPYARARAEELIPLGAKVPGYAAIILSKSFVSQIIRLFMHSQRRQGIHNEIFFSMESAVNWLKLFMGQLVAKRLP